MSRIPTPSSIEAAPAAAQPHLREVQKRFGSVPNLFRLMANSPAAIDGHLRLSDALRNGALSAATQARIAIAVAAINGCEYCLSAHSYLGKRIAKLDDAELAANRLGSSHDPEADAAVRFAATLVRRRGQVAETDVQALKSAGYSDAQLIEIVLHVALNTWTNYLNLAAQTEIDFPVVKAPEAA